jgi:hypothetical protein
MAKRKARSEDASLAVYDGQTLLGFVLEMSATAFVAYDADGRMIDTYKTRNAATRAIPRGREES